MIGSLVKVRYRRKITVFQVYVRVELKGVEGGAVLALRTKGHKRAVRCATLRCERVGLRVVSAKLFDAAFRNVERRGIPTIPGSTPQNHPQRREKRGGGARPARTGAISEKARKQASRALKRLAAALSSLGVLAK